MNDTQTNEPGGTTTDEPSADPSVIPTEHATPERRRVGSVVVVNTGDGKGKSSAAFGVVLRAVARDWRVGVVQFLKSGKWQVGEEKVARERLGVDWWAIGEGFTWDSDDLTEDQAVAQAAWKQAASIIAGGEHRLVVLDEITYPMNWGWISTDEVVAVIAGRPEQVNIVCTGRDAPAALIDVADTVSEIRKIKHAYDTGVLAMKGIDY
jgi:cob(I)alamin adenosyltransferase